MDSIWQQDVSFPRRPTLPGDQRVQAAVIGGGMAGLLTAWTLQQRGVETLVLEAATVASGQTGRTTAKLTAQHGLRLAGLLASLGEEAARLYVRANQQAIEAFCALIEKRNIDCGLERCPSYLYSRRESDPLRREARAAEALGVEAVFTTDTALPFSVRGAVCFPDQAQFHPLRFLRALTDELTIYERTKVLSVNGKRVRTDHGDVVADHIVFATHYPFLLRPGYYFLRMHQQRSYVLALQGAQKLDGMYLGVDADAGWSMRNAEGLLLLGGGGHRTGENRAGGQYRALRNAADQLWPGCVEKAHWSAQDCMTLDHVPYIGRFSASTPHWYVATGFEKWGMTSSMVAARLLADCITGRRNPYAALFSPQRFTPSASAAHFLSDGAHAVRDLSRRVFSPPRAAVEALPPGHGGVVECDGEKLGVYKAPSGALFCVSVRCPHLGCQLEWNPDEKSWDCPCHGSRFDYTGRLLDNPAQEGLERG